MLSLHAAELRYVVVNNILVWGGGAAGCLVGKTARAESVARAISPIGLPEQYSGQQTKKEQFFRHVRRGRLFYSQYTLLLSEEADV